MKSIGITIAIAGLVGMVVLGLLKKRAQAGFCFGVACLGAAMSQWGG